MNPPATLVDALMAQSNIDDERYGGPSLKLSSEHSKMLAKILELSIVYILSDIVSPEMRLIFAGRFPDYLEPPRIFKVYNSADPRVFPPMMILAVGGSNFCSVSEHDEASGDLTSGLPPHKDQSTARTFSALRAIIWGKEAWRELWTNWYLISGRVRLGDVGKPIPLSAARGIFKCHRMWLVNGQSVNPFDAWVNYSGKNQRFE